MDFLTRLDPSGPINRFLGGASGSIARRIKEELIEAINYLFDKKLAPFSYMVNCMIAERIKQTKDEAKVLLDDAFSNIKDLKDEFKSDIEDLLNNVDAKYKDNLRLTFEEINQARAEALSDLRKTLKYIDQSIEERINQFFRELMIFFKEVAKIIDKFTPGAIKANLVDPTFDRLDKLENQLYQDLDQILDKVAQVTDFALNEFQTRVLNRFGFIDSRFGIGKKNWLCKIPASSLTDIEIYRYLCAVELDKINNYIQKNDLIEKIVDSYSQLQIIAYRMYFKAKTLEANTFKDICLRDWVKYGIALEVWKVYLA